MKPNSFLVVILSIATLHARAATIIEFASSNILSDEFAGTAKVSIVRQGSTAAADSVTVSTADGTAKAGEDYEAVSTFVTFAAEETNMVVEIPIKDDYFAEPDKVFVVHITDLPPGITSGNSEAQVTILDDERPGSIDVSWTSALGMPAKKPGNYFYAPSIVQPDGKVIVTLYRSASNPFQEDRRVIRLNSDGSMDSAFLPIVTLPYWTSRLPDGKIILSEAIPNSSVTTAKLKRYNPDGSLDGTFTANVQGTPQVVGLSNGKMLLLGCSPYYGGQPNRVNGTAVQDLVRLTDDGSLDSTFAAPAAVTFVDFGSFPQPPVVVFPNGKILVGTSTSRLVYLLNEEGSPDPNFAVGSATLLPDSPNPSPFVLGLRVQSDGKILVGGFFDEFNGTVRNGIMRLNSDGTVDDSFHTGLGFGPGGGVSALDLLPNGQMLVNGLGPYNGEATPFPIVLNPDGSRDRAFERSRMSSFDYYTFADGRIIFPTEWGLAEGRLCTEFPLRIVSTSRGVDGTTRLTANALNGRSYTLQASDDLANWSDLTTQSATTNRIDFTDAPAVHPANRFYRVRRN